MGCEQDEVGRAVVDEEALAALQRLYPDELAEGAPFSHNVAKQGLASHSLTPTLRALPRDTAGGPTGWTYELVAACTKGGGGMGLGGMLTDIAKRVATGKDVPNRDWLCASNLIPLNKSNGGIRPIACGEAFARVLARWALSYVVPKDLLLPTQFGVGSLGGAEPVVGAVKDAVEHQGEGTFLSIDFANAFNTVSRHQIANAVQRDAPELYRLAKFFYNEPSQLLVAAADGKMRTLESRTGVRPGDPLGPLLFSLAIKDLVKELTERFAVERPGKAQDAPRNVLWAYLDDVVLDLKQGIDKEQVIDFLQTDKVVRKFGVSVNPDKCCECTAQEMAATGQTMLGL